MDEIYTVFIQESHELLEAMESGLLLLEQGNRDDETIHAIFRAAHTIKGGAGVVDLGHVERFTHVLESLLEDLRTHRLDISESLIGALLRAGDHLSVMLDKVAAGQLEADPELQPETDAVLAMLKEFHHGDHPAPSTRQEGSLDVEHAPSAEDSWLIRVMFGKDILRNGMEPLAFLRHLATLGEIRQIHVLSHDLPAAEAMDPESCYLGFDVLLQSAVGKEAIEKVFMFCRDDCELSILPPATQVGDFVNRIADLPEEQMRLGEMLVRAGALTPDELAQGLRGQDAVAEQGSIAPPLGEILVRQQVVQPEIVDAAVSRQKQVKDKASVDARLIRVRADKLDQLIDLVGELVIAGASASLLARQSGQTALVEATSLLGRLVENIRDSALQLHMVQIGETFRRFYRVVRDVAKELGKDIDLVVSGGDTELDKSVVEKITDPLMHLIRNAIDHGIERSAERLACGKSAMGTVALSARHDSGSIVIEVADDGRGIDTTRVHDKAVEKGLIHATQVLSDKEIINLIFEPGFSTADHVSNISGRGVGMDVVRKNVQALRGSVEVSSEQGKGSVFTIRLPLTLAIIDGFLTGVSDASYVVPLDAVVECVELSNAEQSMAFLNLRGEVLPLIDLRVLFNHQDAPPRRRNVVVVRHVGGRAGLVVDHLFGEFQTVIKPLGALFRNERCLSGSTILGSGEVALILDVQSLVRLSTHQSEGGGVARERLLTGA